MKISRTGLDRRNSSKTELIGPKLGLLIQIVDLPKNDSSYDNAAIVVSPNNFKVINKGMLSSVSNECKILWTHEITEFNNLSSKYTSAPLIKEDGNIIVTGVSTITEFDISGLIVNQIESDFTLDDSNISPNISDEGLISLTGPAGNLAFLKNGKIIKIADRGYDVLSPPFYPDNSMLAVFYYNAIYRIDLKGNQIWKNDYKEADMVATINKNNICAVGSKNNKESIIISSSGDIISKYNRPALFSEYSEDEWIALSSDKLAKINNSAEIIWEYKFEEEIKVKWGEPKPIIDKNLNVYALTSKGLLALDKNGNVLYNLKFNLGVPKAFNIIHEEKIALIIGNNLLLIK
jgi:hypothetical protein